MTHSLLLEKLAELAASILILVPSMALLAWGSELSNLWFYWAVLTGGCAMIIAALVARDRKRGAVTAKGFLSKCGGFLFMFLFLLYQLVQPLF